MRILHLLAPAPFGGLERVVQDLSRAQAESGHQVMTAAIGQTEADVRPFLAPLDGTPVEGTPFLIPPRGYLAERAGVRRLCRRWKADLLHTHGYRPDVVDGGAARSLGIGTTATVHGFTGGGWKNRFYEWLQCRAYRRFGAVVAVSRPLRETLISHGVPAERLHVVRNALAKPDFLSREKARERLQVRPGEYHIGWIGRLSPEKGPDVFLDALAAMETRRGIRVSIMGDGPLREALHASARDQSLDDAVHFLGSMEDASRLLAGFDLVVLSSRTEGTPMVLLEAMAAGLPTVVTKVGGIPDMVSEKEAYIIPSEDPRALARALREAREAQEASGSRGQAAQRRFQAESSLEAWVRSYDVVYGAATEKVRR